MPERVLLTTNPPNVGWIESNFMQSRIGADSQTSVRHAQLDHANYNSFRAAMLGWSEVDGAGKLIRYPPETHDREPWMVARDVEFVQPLGEPSDDGPGNSLLYKSNQGDFANIEVAVTYEAVPGVNFAADLFKPAGATDESWRFCKFSEEQSLAARIIPRGTLQFTWSILGIINADVVVPEPGVAMEITSQVTVIWYQIPAVINAAGIPALPRSLEANIAAVEGRTNNALFMAIYPPRTLFCLAVKKELRMMANGLLCFDLTYNWERRGKVDTTGVADHIGTEDPAWDRIRAGDALFYRVHRKSDPTKSIFYEADFKKLFQLT